MKTNKDFEQFKNVNPFKVPDGYFERFSEDLMQKLPEREMPATPQVTLWTRLKPLVYMAAMFCGFVLCAEVLFNMTAPKEDTTVAIVTSEDDYNDYFIETVINSNNQLIDDYTLYSYLTEAQ